MRRAGTVFFVTVASALLVGEARGADADGVVSATLPEPEPELPQPPPPRPRLSAAVGMGATFDSVGSPTGTAHAIPAFFSSLGVGDGFAGAELRAFASSGLGRYSGDDPIDRLALTGFAVIRPAARLLPDDQSYRARLLRTLGGELGLGFERDGRSMSSGTRFVVHTGARIEFPLTPAGSPRELRLRLAVSRAFGLYTPRIYSPMGELTEVVDTAAEAHTALVVVF